MNKRSRFHIAGSLVLLAIFFSSYGACGQIPKLFLKFVAQQNQVKSGYVKLQVFSITDNDPMSLNEQETFFISTPKDLKYLTWYHAFDTQSSDTDVYCKSAHTVATFWTRKKYDYAKYYYNDDRICDAKHDIDPQGFPYLTENDLSLERWKDGVFQRISPKVNKKNIRYKIRFPDNDIDSDRSEEWEFDGKTFNWIQGEFSTTYLKTERLHSGTDILEQRLYSYIHPDILDTVSFMFEDLKKGYDRQHAVELAKKDSAFRDSIVRSITQNGYRWTDPVSQEVPQDDSLFFMPEWKLPLLSGDTIFSDSITAQFLLIDMWYVSCHPCRMAMRELSSIDTLYEESLLKMVSINVFDKDTAKISRVVKNLNLQCDIACAYDEKKVYEMSKSMGKCRGYPQLYLIDMKTRRVIWSSCGWYEGFTKDIEAKIKQ
jgi:hypothetical protein